MHRQGDRKACWDRLAGQKTMMAAETLKMAVLCSQAIHACLPSHFGHRPLLVLLPTTAMLSRKTNMADEMNMTVVIIRRYVKT